MERLIDADELKLELKWLEIDKPVYHDVMSTIDEMATVDAVKVVRCKDCKWYERRYPWNGNSYECSYLEAPMDDNDFCSWGERRKDETC